MLFLTLIPVAFALFVISPVSSTDPSTQASIDKICRQMEDYGFCNKLYQDQLKGGSSDMHGLAQIAQQVAINTAAKIRLQIMDLIGEQSI